VRDDLDKSLKPRRFQLLIQDAHSTTGRLMNLAT
jgi:hypothetical protein